MPRGTPSLCWECPYCHEVYPRRIKRQHLIDHDAAEPIKRAKILFGNMEMTDGGSMVRLPPPEPPEPYQIDRELLNRVLNRDRGVPFGESKHGRSPFLKGGLCNGK